MLSTFKFINPTCNQKHVWCMSTVALLLCLSNTFNLKVVLDNENVLFYTMWHHGCDWMGNVSQQATCQTPNTDVLQCCHFFSCTLHGSTMITKWNTECLFLKTLYIVVCESVVPWPLTPKTAIEPISLPVQVSSYIHNVFSGNEK
jgi:hypothetical protein